MYNELRNFVLSKTRITRRGHAAGYILLIRRVSIDRYWVLEPQSRTHMGRRDLDPHSLSQDASGPPYQIEVLFQLLFRLHELICLFLSHFHKMWRNPCLCFLRKRKTRLKFVLTTRQPNYRSISYLIFLCKWERKNPQYNSWSEDAWKKGWNWPKSGLSKLTG